MIVPRPGSGRQGGGEHVMFMSIIRSALAPLSHGAVQHQSAAAICWTPALTFQPYASKRKEKQSYFWMVFTFHAHTPARLHLSNLGVTKCVG